MSESNINVTPGTGGPNIDLELIDNGNARQVICIGDPTTGTKVATVSSSGGLSVDITGVGAAALGQETMAASLPVVVASDQSPIQTVITQGGNTAVVDSTGDVQTDVNNQIQLQPSLLVISAVGASAAAVMATLPAVVGQSHYITGLEIVRYATVVNTASATPVTVTTTNLPGSLAFTFDNGADALGSVSVRTLPLTMGALKSSVANTATTIVAPASTGILWRINVYYYTAV